MVTRVYDIGAVAPLLDEEGVGGFRLAPALAREGDFGSPPAHLNVEDEVASVLLSAFGSEFEFEGRSFEVLSDRRARITAPAETHKDVVALLQFLEQGFRRSVTLRVDWIDRPDDAPLSQPLVPLADADKLVAAATQARRSYLNVQPGRTASFSALRSYEVVSDYDVEIAQAATIADPIVGSFHVGTQCGVRAAASNGGVWVVTAMSDSALARPSRRIELNVGAVITSERGADRVSAPAPIESLSVMQGAVALSLFIPDGQAAVIDMGMNVRTGARRGAIVLRREGPTATPLSTFAARGSVSSVELVDASWFVRPILNYEGSLSDLPSLHGVREWWAEYEDRVHLESGDAYEFVQAIEDGMRVVQLVGPWVLATAIESDAKPLAGSAALTNPPPPECAGVWFRLRRGQDTLAAWGLPVAAGSEQRFALGGETWSPMEADVEVAQSSATIDPVVGSRLDGVLGSLRASRAQDGAWSLDLRILAHVLAAQPTVFSSGSLLQIDIERNEFDDLQFDDRITLGGANGPRSRTIGMSGALELDVDLR